MASHKPFQLLFLRHRNTYEKKMQRHYQVKHIMSIEMFAILERYNGKDIIQFRNICY